MGRILRHPRSRKTTSCPCCKNHKSFARHTSHHSKKLVKPDKNCAAYRNMIKTGKRRSGLTAFRCQGMPSRNYAPNRYIPKFQNSYILPPFMTSRFFNTLPSHCIAFHRPCDTHDILAAANVLVKLFHNCRKNAETIEAASILMQLSRTEVDKSSAPRYSSIWSAASPLFRVSRAKREVKNTDAKEPAEEYDAVEALLLLSTARQQNISSTSFSDLSCTTKRSHEPVNAIRNVKDNHQIRFAKKPSLQNIRFAFSEHNYAKDKPMVFETLTVTLSLNNSSAPDCIKRNQTDFSMYCVEKSMKRQRSD